MKRLARRWWVFCWRRWEFYSLVAAVRNQAQVIDRRLEVTREVRLLAFFSAQPSQNRVRVRRGHMVEGHPGSEQRADAGTAKT
eukprot:scaffold2350_cov64-Phaeocystis_antarctica.AAC.3